MKWILVLLLAVGVFFAVQNWPTISAKWNEGVAQLSAKTGDKPGTTSGSAVSPTKLLNTVTAVSWGNRSVAGITLDLPFGVDSYTPTASIPTHPNIVAEYYHGGGSTRAIFIKHETNTTMAGEIMLAWQNRSIESEAKRLNMDIMSRNSAATVINGFRARRTDMISHASSPRLRARFVTFERGNQGWMVQFNCLESDPEGEQIYQRIANSAH